MKIQVITDQLNTLSKNYNIGQLQDIRKKIKGLSKKPGSKIFHNSTISDEGWAFHYGGRKELQFNIGFEEEGLRYGIAFSLEPSQSLPDVSILYPKILKLNCIMREQTRLFDNYRMWSWQRNHRTDIHQVKEIPPELAVPHNFIFIGKIQNLTDDMLKCHALPEGV